VWHVIALVAALAAAGGGYRWLRGDSAQAEAAYQVVAAARGSLTASISPTGEVQAARQQDLRFDVQRVALLEVYVTAGQQVVEGQPLARVDEAPLQRAVDQARADALAMEEALQTARAPYTALDVEEARLAVAQAEAALREAQQSLEDLGGDDVADARAAVAQAQYAYDSAVANLAIVQHSNAVGKAVRDLEYSVAWRERALRDVQARKERGEADQAAVDAAAAALADHQNQLAIARTSAAVALAEAEDRVTEARAALAEAQAALTDLRAGDGALARLQAEDRVTQAELDLARARERLAAVSAGPDPQDILLAQARYDAALATLQDAQEALDNATLRAPFDGTVLSVSAEAGDLLTPSTTVLTLADLTSRRVLVAVDETDISQVAAGQAATITFDALPGQRFSGRVLEVPLEGTLSSSVVTYPVPVSLEGAENAALLPGMTANVTITTGRSEDALLVPILALEQDDQGYYVLVEDGAGGSTMARVQAGLDNGQYVEIKRGLLEGDRVLVRLPQDTSSQFPFGGRGGATAGVAIPVGGMRR